MLYDFRFTSYRTRRISLKCSLKKKYKCFQNAGLRDIAHIADTFATKGLDEEQIASISKIRLIAHECLRDQVGGPVIMSAIPVAEFGKRARGKERVRRKSTSGKRLRKDDDDVVHCEDEQPQFYASAMEADQLQIIRVDKETDDAQLYAAESEFNPVPLIHAHGDGDGDGENPQLCGTNMEADQSELVYAAGDENIAEPNSVATGVNNNEDIKHAAGEINNKEQNHQGSEVANEELKHSAGQVIKEEELDQMIIDKENIQDAPKEVDNSQLCNESHEINSKIASENGDLSKANSQRSDSMDKVVSSHIDSETEPPNVTAAKVVSQHSSVEIREDIAQKGDSVACCIG